jgi:hypothetical protein
MTFSSVIDLVLEKEETIPFLLDIFKSHDPVVFPSLHTVVCGMGRWNMPTEEEVLEFLRWRIAIGHPIGILRVFQGGESVTWENFTALQAVSGLLVSFR